MGTQEAPPAVWGQALTPGSCALTKMHQGPSNGAGVWKAAGGGDLAFESSGRNGKQPSLCASVLGEGGPERWQCHRQQILGVGGGKTVPRRLRGGQVPGGGNSRVGTPWASQWGCSSQALGLKSPYLLEKSFPS